MLGTTIGITRNPDDSGSSDSFSRDSHDRDSNVETVSQLNAECKLRCNNNCYSRIKMPSDINGVDYCNANATFYRTAKCKLLFRRHDFGFYSLSDGKWRENFSLRNKTLSGLT